MWNRLDSVVLHAEGQKDISLIGLLGVDGGPNFSVVLPRDAVPARCAVVLCLSVCQSVTSRHCTEMAKRRIKVTAPYDNPGTPAF